jgi:hypothetical protein
MKFSSISVTTVALAGVSAAFPLFSQNRPTEPAADIVSEPSTLDSRSEAGSWPSFPQREQTFGPSAALGISGMEIYITTRNLISDETIFVGKLGLFGPKRYTKRSHEDEGQ